MSKRKFSSAIADRGQGWFHLLLAQPQMEHAERKSLRVLRTSRSTASKSKNASRNRGTCWYWPVGISKMVLWNVRNGFAEDRIIRSDSTQANAVQLLLPGYGRVSCNVFKANYFTSCPRSASI